MSETNTAQAELPLDNPLAAETPAVETPVVEASEEAPANPLTEEDETAARMKKLSVDARDARRRTRALESEIAVLRGQKMEAPDEELERKVTQRATEIAATAAFNNRCNAIHKEGVKAFGATFNESVAALNEALGAIPIALIEAADDAGEPAKLLNYLGENTDIAEALAGLSPHRMGVEMAKLAAKLNAPKPKAAVSKAPPPIKPVAGAASADFDPVTSSISDYMKHEDARMMERR